MGRMSKAVKRGVAVALGRLGLLPAATDLYQWFRSRERPRGAETGVDDGLPLPPAGLRLSAAGTTDPGWFLASGREGAALIGELLAAGEWGTGPRAVLDFGCGCGRVLRHLRAFEGVELHGVDWNPRAVRWCRRHLRFAALERGALGPPLPFSGRRFHLVYAFSVFTHLPERLQVSWLAEIASRLHPGGLLALSTHGEAFEGALRDEERARYRRGELVVREPAVAGTNVCAAYHPRGALERLLPRDLEALEHRPSGARGNPPQDLWLLRKVG